MHDQTRSIRAVFTDPQAGFAAMDELRRAGFVIDASADGDVVVTVQTAPDRRDELESIVETYGGTVR